MALFMKYNKPWVWHRIIVHRGSGSGLLSSSLPSRSKHGSGRGGRRRQRQDMVSSAGPTGNGPTTEPGIRGHEASHGNDVAGSTNSGREHEFNSQYFGDVLDTMVSSSAKGASESNIVPEAHKGQQSKVYVNEFDAQYFQDLGDNVNSVPTMQRITQSQNEPGSTINSHYMFNDIDLNCFDDISPSFVFSESSENQVEQCSQEDTHVFDQQYFREEHLEFQHKHEMDLQKKKSAALYIDTTKSEEELYRKCLSDNRKRTNTKGNGMIEQRNNNKSMIEQMKATLDKSMELRQLPATYQHVSSADEGDYHREVHFISSPAVDKSFLDTLSSDLRVKLTAERQLQEKDEELRVGHNSTCDLESSVVSALSATKKKPPKKTKLRLAKGMRISGTEAKDIPVSSVPCSGCGAHLHCQDRSKPGFIPSEKFKEIELMASPLSSAVCQRCWYLIHHHAALNIAIPHDHYSDIIKTVRKNHKALVIVMVDLLDFPCSIIRNLGTVLGSERPVIIVGNKLDILPKDEPRYEQRIKKHLLSACVEAGVCSENSVKYIGLISAKTGYGIEDLISKIYSIRARGGDVYLLGTANVGKSTLFNRLVDSDLCKVKASQMMGRATISRWPGTTLNLLRFPLLNPTKERMALRAKRLKEEALVARQQELEMRQGRHGKGEIDFEDQPRLDAYLEGRVGQTFKPKSEDHILKSFLPGGNDPFSQNITAIPPPSTDRGKAEKASGGNGPPAICFDPNEFEMGAWFYDTPGLVCTEQVLTLLNNEELKLVMPKKGLIPRSLILKPGHSFFLGGLGRLDYVEGTAAIFLTVFSSHALPVRVLPTNDADAVYQQKAGSKYFVVPQGGQERMASFPELMPTDMRLRGEGQHKSVADVLFSSAGWAGVTANQDVDVHVRAYTPGGLGCLLRRPSLVPRGFALRGPRRSRSSPYYSIDRKKLLMYMT